MNVFKEILSDYGREKAEMMERYWDIVAKTNQTLNLTRITEPEEVAKKHFLDSLSVLNIADLSTGRILDIGTGAGFPGVPLSICTGNENITLLDSSRKKIEFVKNACAKLGINVKTLNARAEDLSSNQRDSYDYIVSRAVAELRILIEIAIPLLKKGGVFFAYKRNSESELMNAGGAIEKLGAELIRTYDTGIEDHVILCFEKKRETDKKYPRRYAQIKSKPL